MKRHEIIQIFQNSVSICDGSYIVGMKIRWNMILSYDIGNLKVIIQRHHDFCNENRSHLLLSHEIICLDQDTHMVANRFHRMWNGNCFLVFSIHINHTLFFWMRERRLIKRHPFFWIPRKLQEVSNPRPHWWLRSNNWIRIVFWKDGKSWRLFITVNLKIKDTRTSWFGRYDSTIGSENSFDLYQIRRTQITLIPLPNGIHTEPIDCKVIRFIVSHCSSKIRCLSFNGDEYKKVDNENRVYGWDSTPQLHQRMISYYWIELSMGGDYYWFPILANDQRGVVNITIEASAKRDSYPSYVFHSSLSM